MTTPEQGDWIRFYVNGSFVIGEVRYIRRSIAGTTFYQTDAGEVSEASVLEVRRADVPSPEGRS